MNIGVETEQIEILENRGLSIPDEQAAYDFLMNNNYYRNIV